MRVLLVDDSPVIRRILGRIMTDFGFEIFEAGNGVEALAHLDSDQGVDLALIDWEMPVMDGIEFAHRVRASADYHSLPLLMVTGDDLESHLDQARQAGVNAFVSKPFSHAVIHGKLLSLGIEVPELLCK